MARDQRPALCPPKTKATQPIHHRPCKFFLHVKCKNSIKCKFAHVAYPDTKRKPCQYFMKGKCNRGDQSNSSHEQSSINDSRHANSTAEITCILRENFGASLREFRWKVPKQVFDFKPLGYRLGKFFQQVLELIDGGVETLQEVINLLTSERGLLRIEELLELPFSTLSSSQLTTVITNQLLLFFRIFTYPDVIGSIFLRAKVITVHNIIYPVAAGHRFRYCIAKVANSSIFINRGIKQQFDHGFVPLSCRNRYSMHPMIFFVNKSGASLQE
jgi:hypothetical protein